MIYALKLLFFVLAAGGAACFLLRPAFAGLLTPQQYRRAWISLLVVTCIAFLSFRTEIFLVLIAVAAVIASNYLGSGDNGKVNAFLLFLFPLPPIYAVLGGIEGLNYVLLLDHMRLLSLVLLTVPAVRLLFRQRDRNEPSLLSVDIAMLLVQFWSLFIVAQSANVTGIARSLVIAFCDVLVPYYVVTRTIRTASQLKEAATHLMLGCLLMASVACVESLMQRNLYAGLQWIYDLRWETSVDIMRNGRLRVESSNPQTIVLGFGVTFGAALWTWLRGQATPNKVGYALYLVLGFALVSTWSRGPWLGAGLLIIALVLQRWLSPRAVGVTIVLSLIAAVLVKSFGGDDAVMAGLAAMFGNTENDLGTITYRRDLLDATLALIKQSPWMGVPNFETALASFRQGEGIIDIVNSYLAIMLNAGIPGCVLYLVPYVLVVAKMLGVHGKERGSSRAVSGSFAPVFVALILTVLFIIFTVASIGVIPYVLVLAVAFPVAWLRQARHEVHPSEVPLSGRPLRHGLSRGWVDASGLMRR